jgi:hypothetical protein
MHEERSVPVIGQLAVVVSLGDEALVLDPTDKEVADADNLREGYGLDADAVKQLRSMLRGDLSSPGVG